MHLASELLETLGRLACPHYLPSQKSDPRGSLAENLRFYGTIIRGLSGVRPYLDYKYA
jgi:hypothetical protein